MWYWWGALRPPSPQYDQPNRRHHEIKIRLTDSELAAIRDRCDQPQLAKWLREVALDQKPRRRSVPKCDPQLIRQLAAIGNNLNQVARLCNRRRAVEVVEVSARLVAIQRELELLRASQIQ